MIWILIFGLLHSVEAANEKVLQLEDMNLKREKVDSELPVEVLKRSGVAAGFLGEIEGYDLSRLQPFVGLFSETYYVPSSDNTKVTDTRNGNVITVPIFRASYDDGSIVLAEKDENGNIAYVELRRSRGTPDVFLIPSQSSDPNFGGQQSEESEFLTFTEDDVDYDELRSKFQYGEASTPDGSGDDDTDFRHLRANSNTEPWEKPVPSHDYRNGRDAFIASSSFSSSLVSSPASGLSGCPSYRVVNLAVVFDTEFCGMYGSMAAARRRIMTIVASASFHYERDMCVQLRLTDIYTPEQSCSQISSNSYFRNFFRHFPCGRENSFLSRFAKWTKRYRNRLDLDEDATVHIFSGYPPPGGTIGCAFVGSFCNRDYSYGIEYMSFAMNPHSQGVVLAHEIGHILNANHLFTNTNYMHVMEPNINNAQDGFNIYSINSILNFLNSDQITCDGFTNNLKVPLATLPPSPRPTPLPTPVPTPQPTPRAVQSPSRVQFNQPDDTKCSLYQDGNLEPKCVFKSQEEDKYACFDPSSLLDARATSACLFPTPRARILRCEGPLRTGQRLGNDRFATSSCSASCVVVGNSLCFRVDDQQQAYTISFVAVADFDVFSIFTTNVHLKDDDGSATCDVATTRCIS